MAVNISGSFVDDTNPMTGDVETVPHIGIQGPPGPQGDPGGYYVPAIEQTGENELEVSFSPSLPDMPYVAPVKVTVTPDPDSGVDLTGYATEEYVQEYAQPKGNYLESTALPTAINTALSQAKESGEFKGEPGEPGADGKDYVLTEEDRTEIAEQAAAMVEVPDYSAFYVTITGKAGNYTADKTFAETKEAYEAGRPVYAVVNATIDNFHTNDSIWPIVNVFESSIFFHCVEYGRELLAAFSNSSVTLRQCELAEKADIPTDDEIIALINEHAPDSAGAFNVTVTESDGKYTADKTPSEIYAAHSSGVPVQASLMVESGIITAYLVTATEDAAMFQVPNFMLGEEQTGATVTIAGNNPADRSVTIVETTGGGGTVKTVNGVAPDENGNVQITIPDSGGNVDLGVTAATVGQTVKISAVDENGVPTAWEPVDFPSGGGVAHTEAVKIVDYTVDADSKSAASFEFTVTDYPELAKYNTLVGVYKKTANGSLPWTKVRINGEDVAKRQQQTSSMLQFRVMKKGDIYSGYVAAAQSPSMYHSVIADNLSYTSGTGNLLPKKIGALTSISISSYQAFLDEGATIEIWGWNE